MKQHYDAIIVGGGVMGSSIAYQLSKRNMQVLIIEKDGMAKKASSAAAGMLGAQSELEGDHQLFPLAQQSRAMFPVVAEELKSLSGIDIELKQTGILKVAQTEDELTHLKSVAALQRSMGQEAEWLSAEKIRMKEPELSAAALGGFYIPNDGQVSAPLLSKAFAQSAAVLGTDMLEYTKVDSFIRKDNRIIGVKTTAGTYYAEEIVVAGGAWSSHILQKAGESLDVYPVKGECFAVQHDQQMISSSIFLTNGYIVPKSGGRLIIGATQKPGDFDQTVHLHGLSGLIANATNMIPALKEAKWENAWAGIRPQTGDDLPYIGRCPHVNGLSVAAGHFRNGILLSPITGILVADLLEGKPVDDTFAIDRKLLEEVNS
ncbi:glycine oxidase ThiO [Lentibacillus cibarius]|uniref:glycine oxidase n=1 Tax=Lentibacillus cibarius TaxID=2583219 RepID=A0A5S3QFM6_9BACI|nr:glycine oxidase ThiO [Lentibacillus cibarius]TMN20744.1 glycine oxidase ThiO [Lentibacillus cibarius]